MVILPTLLRQNPLIEYFNDNKFKIIIHNNKEYHERNKLILFTHAKTDSHFSHIWLCFLIILIQVHEEYSIRRTVIHYDNKEMMFCTTCINGQFIENSFISLSSHCKLSQVIKRIFKRLYHLHAKEDVFIKMRMFS